MRITDDFGIEIDVDEISVDGNGYHVFIFDNDDDPDEILANDIGVCDYKYKLNNLYVDGNGHIVDVNDIDEYIFISENGECEVFSREEMEHLMSL